MPADLVSTAVGDDSDRAVRNVPQQSERLLQMKYHGERVGSIDVIHGPIRCCFRAANFSLQQGIEGPLYVPRSERAAIVKLHALMQVEYISQRIWDFPTLRQSRLHVKMLVAGAQVIEQQLINSLGIGFQTNPWIQIGGAALDNHHQCVWVWFTGTGEQRKKKERKNCYCPRGHSPPWLCVHRGATKGSRFTHTRFFPKS